MGHHVMRRRGARRVARRAACAGPWWQGAAAADGGRSSVRRGIAARIAELRLLPAPWCGGMAPWRAVKGHRGAVHVDGAGAGRHWRLCAPQQHLLAAAEPPCTAAEPACPTSVAPLSRPGLPRALKACAPANVAAPRAVLACAHLEHPVGGARLRAARLAQRHPPLCVCLLRPARPGPVHPACRTALRRARAAGGFFCNTVLDMQTPPALPVSPACACGACRSGRASASAALD